MKVCEKCGVDLAQNRLDRWVHVDGIPKNYEFHEAVPVDRSQRVAMETEFTTLHQAAADMLHHHIAGHPESDCLFARRLREAIDRS